MEMLGRFSSADEDFTLIIGRFEVDGTFEDGLLCFPSVFLVFFASDEVFPEK